LVSVAAGAVSGFPPAMHAGRKSLASSLRERDSARGGIRLGKIIVAAPIALSLMLVIDAALIARTLTALVSRGRRLDTSSLVSFGVDPRGDGYGPCEPSRLIRGIDDGIRASATTEASAVARYPLLTGGSWNNQMTIQAARRVIPDRDVNLNSVTPGFFAT